MPIHITVVCDTCKQAQPAAFESDNETAGDLKRSYQGIGWHLSQMEGTHPIVATCPKCARCPHAPGDRASG